MKIQRISWHIVYCAIFFPAVMTVKKYLADLYLTGAGSNSDPEKLMKKIKYYQEFLDVIGKVDRGYPPVSYEPLGPK